MAGSVNKVILVGNLGRDPEARQMNDGRELVNLSLATSETWRDQQGERRERTEWHRVVIFNQRLGEVARRYLRKGSKVYLEGQLQTRKWTDQQGSERYTTEVVLGQYRGALTMLDSRSDSGASGYPGDQDMDQIESPSGRPSQIESLPQADAAAVDGGPPGNQGGDLDDDIPF